MMDDFEDDEALARLRAADPATGAHPNLHRISEKLRGRTPLGSSRDEGGRPSGYAFSTTSDTAVHVSDPGVRTGRAGLLVAASVAALALGGGGFAAGLSAGSDDDTVTTVAGTQDAGGQREDGLTADKEAPELIGVGESAGDEAMGGDGDMGVAVESGSDSGGYAGPVIPVAGDGLSTERTSGTVYAPAGGQGADPTDLLEQYAAGLGMEGQVNDYDRAADMTDATDARSVHVNSYGGLTSLDYSNPAVDPYCEQSKAESGDSGYGWFGPGGPALEDLTCVPAGPLPDEESAIATVKEFLDQAGVDYTGYEFSTDPMYHEMLAGSAMEGDDTASATAAPDDASVATGEPEPLPIEEPVEGITDLPIIARNTAAPLTDYRSWHFSVTGGGLAYASLQLGDLVELGDYPVISATEAVERATDTRFQQIGVYIPDVEYGETYLEEWTEPAPLPALSPGDQIPFPMSESTVTRAELSTGVLSMWDGTEYLVPVYHLSDDEGHHWQVLGLAEDALDFAP
ncbi:hypothetical protein [Ornithinimicrobium cavernae]|uniref:hypothetical protein n=1 Tax=Ornithinimicrobium cavernae TaxID=2666047 RepID=UPI000D692614|nr:hypothetical protein [Ornithinimicrobium cavernae]